MKQLRPYKMRVPGHDENPSYEFDANLVDTKKCTVWVLHMKVPTEHIEPTLQRATALFNIEPTPLTGEYGYGDSWFEWGEDPHDEDDDLHLALYFTVPEPGPFWARRTGQALYALFSSRMTNPEAPAVSTAGDFAEQIDLQEEA